jgi:hypothetical protein
MFPEVSPKFHQSTASILLAILPKSTASILLAIPPQSTASILLAILLKLEA